MVALSLVIAGLVVVIDQVIKYFVAMYLPHAGVVTAIPHLLDLNYVENPGVAFGMFENMRWIFVALTSVIIVILLYIIIFKKKTIFLFEKTEKGYWKMFIDTLED